MSSIVFFPKDVLSEGLSTRVPSQDDKRIYCSATLWLTAVCVHRRHLFKCCSLITSPLRVCMLGNRSISRHELHDDLCAKTILIDLNTDVNVSEGFNGTEAPPVAPVGERTTNLWLRFCNSTKLNVVCDEYFTQNNVTKIEGIPGLASGVLAGTVVHINVWHVGDIIPQLWQILNDWSESVDYFP